MTSQGSDTVTSIFKCNGSNTMKSLRLLKWPSFHRHCSWHPSFFGIGSASVIFTQLAVETKWRSV